MIFQQPPRCGDCRSPPNPAGIFQKDLGGANRLSLLLAFFAIQLGPEKGPPPRFRQHPRPAGHGRLMPHMLPMTTLKIGHPMAFFILMISNDVLLHDRPLTCIPSP
jgi:hypothetical protein